VNYLAHLLLSGDDEDLLIGNFIADAVKGKATEVFTEEVKRGIILHRFIDDFTDHHPVQKRSRLRLVERYRHYSGVLVDIYYDHYLAKNWHEYSSESLVNYTSRVYKMLQSHSDILPERINYMLQYMIPQNWLLSYAGLEGIDKVLNGMSRRTKFESHMEHGIEELELYYEDFEREFREFFPLLQRFVADKISELK